VLVQAAVDLDALGATVDARFTAYEGLEIDVAAPVQPTRVKLQFANPYAYRDALPGGAVLLRLNPAGETSCTLQPRPTR
jgi:hypothetical protein